MWYENDNYLKLFLAGVLGAMKTVGKLASDINDVHHELVTSALMEWQPNAKLYEYPMFASAVEALQGFTSWVSSWQGPSIIVLADELSITMTVPYGKGGTVSFGARRNVPLDAGRMSFDEVSSMYSDLLDLCKTGYQQLLRSKGIAQQSVPTDGQDSGQRVMFPADVLTVNASSGKRYFKIKGGRFAKFGVTVWPEVLQAAGIDPDEITKDTPLTGYVAHAEVAADGKPSKVVKLVKKAA